MDNFTDPKNARPSGGCLILFIALLMIVGLAMWFWLWGRATPKTDQPVPATPTPVVKTA